MAISLQDYLASPPTSRESLHCAVCGDSLDGVPHDQNNNEVQYVSGDVHFQKNNGSELLIQVASRKVGDLGI